MFVADYKWDYTACRIHLFIKARKKCRSNLSILMEKVLEQRWILLKDLALTNSLTNSFPQNQIHFHQMKEEKSKMINLAVLSHKKISIMISLNKFWDKCP